MRFITIECSQSVHSIVLRMAHVNRERNLHAAQPAYRTFQSSNSKRITAASPAEMLVIPSGAVHEQFRNLVLVVENENINVREVRSTQLDERNSHIEVFSIEADPGIIA